MSCVVVSLTFDQLGQRRGMQLLLFEKQIVDIQRGHFGQIHNICWLNDE